MKLIKMDKISIKWRLFIYISLFAAIMLVLLWFFQVVFLQSFYKAIKVNNIKYIAGNIIKNIDSEDLQSYTRTQAQKGDVSIILTDMDGVSLFNEEMGPNNIIRRLSEQGLKSLIEEAKSGNGSYYERFNESGITNEQQIRDDFPGFAPMPKRGRMDSIVYAALATQKDGTQVAVILNANISPVDATVQTIRIQLIFVTVIMLILALFLAFYISKKISKPIIQINASAKELGKGNYDVNFNGKGYQEIAELGSTLNYAAGELSKTDNLRKELIANISHDLRTPLTMITGYAEVMRDLPGENSKENVQIIIDEATRLTTLVNDVLNISKLQSGTEKINVCVFDLTAGIQDILKRYAKLTEQDGYNIKFIHNDQVTVKADELKISQVIYNLVNNAITYTGKDKSVIVNQTVNENIVRIEVIDTGDGIAPDQLKDIWDRYYKADKKHKRAQIGTGLGLSIVKSILVQHNSRFGVNSTLGQGSIFWFELPTEQKAD